MIRHRHPAPHDEAERLLKLADRDIAAFHALKQHPEVEGSAALFHARGAIEKCLRAVLFERQADVPRSHDLTRLAILLNDNGVMVPCPMRDLDLLSAYTVHFRYDEIESDRPDLPRVDQFVVTVRQWAASLIVAPPA
jgi:HEPN domain-containing protein